MNIYKYIDHTFLKDNATKEEIYKWVDDTKKEMKNVASVCTYLEYIKKYKNKLTEISNNLCTVLSFPNGTDSYEKMMSDANEILELGINEIDIVIDFSGYNKHIKDEKIGKVIQYLKSKNNSCIIKIIIEVGELNKNIITNKVLSDLFEYEIDFIKTSTGKNRLWKHEDIIYILDKIFIENKQHNKGFGFKISGGVSDIKKAIEYCNLAKKYFYEITPDNFRIGSSSLLFK